MSGILVTGPNGGQIFLPAAGYRWDDTLSNAGSFGYFWSSTLYPRYDDNAYVLDFYSGGWGWDLSRVDGLSVRAVCP